MIKLLHIQKITGICGSENHLLALLPRLDRSKYTVDFLALTEPEKPMDEYLARLESAGVGTARLNIARNISPGLVIRLYRFICREKYDLVHTHLVHADLYGALAARMAGAKLISSKHACNEFRRGIVGPVDRLAANRAARVITISRAIKEFYLEVEGIPDGKMELIHYGLEPAGLKKNGGAGIRKQFAIPSATKVLINVGRLIPFKDQGRLLEAMTELQRDDYQVELWLVGDGPLEEELKLRARTLGINKSVRFLGFRPDVSSLLQAADIFVFPSYNEGFGLAILEAMACGLPIVASRARAIPELVLHQQTGLLVAPGDSRGLADAVKRLLDNPAFGRQLGALGRQRVKEEFSIPRMVHHTEAVYEQVLRNGAGVNA